MRTTRGFTLVELMMVVAILAVIAVVGAPAFADFIESGKVRSETQRVAGLLALARNHAVSKNREVTVATQVAADGALSVDVYTQQASTTAGGNPTIEYIERSAGAITGLAVGLDNEDIGNNLEGVVFLANGRRRAPAVTATAANPTEITVCNADKDLGRRIRVNSVGRIEVTALGSPSTACR